MRRNLDLYRGESLTFSGVLRNSSGVVDLTNAVMTWRMGTPDGCTTNLTLSESDGISVTDATAGAWSVTVDPADTDDLGPGYYQHQGKAVIGSTTYFFTQGARKVEEGFTGMTTARVVLTGSLRLLRVIGEGETPSAEAMVDGLESLNQTLHNLKSKNADLAYQDITIDDDLPVPQEHIRPIRYMMAAELAPEYGTQLTPEVAVVARESIATLQAYYRRVGRLRADAGIFDRNSKYDYNINTDD